MDSLLIFLEFFEIKKNFFQRSHLVLNLKILCISVKFYYSTLYWIIISSLILLAFNQLSKNMRSFPQTVKQNILFNKLNSIVNGTSIVSNQSDEMHEIINSNIDSNNINTKLAENDWKNFMRIVDKVNFIIFTFYLIVWAIRLP